MKKKVLTSESFDEIKGIHKLSLEYNNIVKKGHTHRLLELMRDHIEEIEELVDAKDKHAFVETGDLIILCFELLLENDVSIDETVKKCFNRYRTKLSKLISEVDLEGGMRC